MKGIKLDEKHKKIALDILKKYFPKARYFVFGSRANHKNLKPFSDLDIAVHNTQKITDSTLGKILEEFSFSDLPFKVDIIDLHTISKEFKREIEADFIELI